MSELTEVSIAERKRSRGTLVVGGLLVLVLVGFIASFVVAAREMSLGEAMRDVAETRWGIVTLADLGAGLMFAALWISMLERRAWRATAWIVGLFLLGNFTTCLYLLVRCVKYRTLREAVLAAR
ncbi:MAG: DUF1475 family protein [Phycisphaeraceae bacterium]|nr:DUF1475 family protein [Phycisphaerales bacterium]MCB9843603.1 DUF1475 family protein [Phycisphaeraceae bacterium]